MRSRVTFCMMALLILAASLTIGSTSTYADVPDSINYSGILTSGGSPVIDGSYSVTFKIYDVASGANPALWTETKIVSTSSGLFTTLLGSMTALPSSVFSGPDRWLGIAVGPDPEMTPRTAIVAVAYAYRIATVDGATGGSVSGDVVVSGGNIELEPSSETAGNITKGGMRFIHDYGIDNTFVGENAGNMSMTGNSNTATGYAGLISNTTGSANTASGASALFANSTGSANTANGVSALVSNTIGNYNSANGASALALNTEGDFNTSSGYLTLFSNTIGDYNTASGAHALQNNISGNENNASGAAALYSNTTGGDNTACGAYALRGNTTGYSNTASGHSALTSNTDGYRNSASGAYALVNTTTGDSNTACGYNSLFTNSTGNANTAIGYGANVSTDALHNATAIGANAVVNANNKIRLGSSTVTVIEGQVAYTFTSDKNQKENFQPVDGDEVLRKIGSLDLSSWNYKGHDPQHFRHYGPMAQEFFEAFGHDGVGTSGSSTTINSGDETGILMIAVQALERRTREVSDLQCKIKTQDELIEELMARLDRLEQHPSRRP